MAMSLMKEFKAFALKGNMIDLAVGVVIGGAFGKVVSALVEDVVMPLVSSVLPGGDWRQYTVTPLKIQLGHLLGSMVDFLLVALVLFIVVVKLMGALNKPDAAAAPTIKQCPECLEAVPIKARRCRACTSALAA
jgi:large conductance mechanosensitive channel